MKTLGTILPTKKDLIKGDIHAEKMEKRREKIGDSKLTDCVKKIVGGEVRWYQSDDTYAIVSRNERVLWFKVTNNGDFPIK